MDLPAGSTALLIVISPSLLKSRRGNCTYSAGVHTLVHSLEQEISSLFNAKGLAFYHEKREKPSSDNADLLSNWRRCLNGESPFLGKPERYLDHRDLYQADSHTLVPKSSREFVKNFKLMFLRSAWEAHEAATIELG